MEIVKAADGKIQILNKVFETTAAKEINIAQIDVVAPELVKQFLEGIGLQLKLEKASEFAEEIVNYYKPYALFDRFKIRGDFYTLPELNLLQFNYFVRYRDIPPQSADKVGSYLHFWKEAFPDTWSLVKEWEYEQYLPKLRGSLAEMEQAKYVRRFQLLDLLHLKRETFDDDFLVHVLKPYTSTFPVLRNYQMFLRNLGEKLIDDFIDSIIQRDRAVDWLATELTTHNLEWLKNALALESHNLKTMIKMLPPELQAMVTSVA
jgi:hypothetical protein